MHVLLTTPRLRLRALTEDDLDQLVALNNDPEVMRHINGGRPVPARTVRSEHLPRLLHDHPCLAGLGDRGYWAAEDRTSGDFLGWFEFRPPAGQGTTAVMELGYRLHRAAWGRGRATEGSRALIDKGFTDLGVQRVTASTMTVNTASRRVLEKAGLRLLRTFFEDWPDSIEGSEQGDVEYVLTRREWTERKRHTPDV